MIEQFLNELNLPGINHGVGEEKPEEVFMSEAEKEHRLTDFVRAQYQSYVGKVLKENYKHWLETETGNFSGLIIEDKVIKKCAEHFEQEAVKACMIVSLYRKSILESIENIRKDTQQNILNTTLIHTKFNSKRSTKDVGCQTMLDDSSRHSNKRRKESSISVSSSTTTTSLDEKIRNFEQKLTHVSVAELKKKKKEKRVSPNAFVYELSAPSTDAYRAIFSPPIMTPVRAPGTPNVNIPLPPTVPAALQEAPITSKPATPLAVGGPTTTPTPFLTPASTCTNISTANQVQDDINEKIMQELQQLFGDENKDTVDDIFGENCDAQIEAITHEIQASTKKQKQVETVSQEPVVASTEFDYSEAQEDFDHTFVDDCSHPIPMSPELHPFEQTEDPEVKERRLKDSLKSSIWPCELHHQRQRLRATLSEIADQNFRQYERVRSRFRELFGEDDDDENILAPYSPSIELDEVLVASCRKRISQWVVKALMRPLKNGLIANRFLFKKLARHVAEGIIYIDQYPDEQFVKEYVQDYFCSHQQIRCLEDIY